MRIAIIGCGLIGKKRAEAVTINLSLLTISIRAYVSLFVRLMGANIPLIGLQI